MDAKRQITVGAALLALVTATLAGALISCGTFDRGIDLWKGP